MNREITIKINNWDKYNPRKDLRSMPWIRLQGDIAFSESLFGLDAEAKWLWVFLLSYSSKKMSGEFSISEKYLSHHSGVSASKFSKYLNQFLSNGLLLIKTNSSRVTNESDRVTNESDRITNESVPYERTNERTNEHTCQSDLAVGVMNDAADYFDEEIVISKDSGIHEHPLEIKTHAEKCEIIATLWNDFAEDQKISKVRLPLSNDRIKLMETALKEFEDFSDWERIMQAIYADDFLIGKNDRGWTANFDWLFHKTKFNYRKLWEKHDSIKWIDE